MRKNAVREAMFYYFAFFGSFHGTMGRNVPRGQTSHSEFGQGCRNR